MTVGGVSESTLFYVSKIQKIVYIKNEGLPVILTHFLM